MYEQIIATLQSKLDVTPTRTLIASDSGTHGHPDTVNVYIYIDSRMVVERIHGNAVVGGGVVTAIDAVKSTHGRMRIIGHDWAGDRQRLQAKRNALKDEIAKWRAKDEELTRRVAGLRRMGCDMFGQPHENNDYEAAKHAEGLRAAKDAIAKAREEINQYSARAS